MRVRVLRGARSICLPFAGLRLKPASPLVILRENGHAGTKPRASECVNRFKDLASQAVGILWKRKKNGSLHRTRLQAVSPRGHEALPERRALLHGQVLGHPPPLSARPARPGTREAHGVRRSAPREA